MRFLHLSDLHIGKTVNGFSMLDEQRHVFEQIIEYVKKECPDAVVIAGDIFDRPIPGVEAVRLLDDLLTDLVEENVTVMIISGNHDSPERLNFGSRLLSDKNLFICANFDGAPHKVVMNDKHGEVNFWLLPFIKPLYVRTFFDRDIDSYSEALALVLNGADIDYSGRNILVSHQFFTRMGVISERSESEMDPIGGLDAIDTSQIERFDYVALGHLHGSQTVGKENIRYAGSPVKYSFSECRHKKSITLVELNKKGDLTVTALPLIPIHDMREIKGEIEQLMNGHVVAAADRNDYLRVILTNEDYVIDPMGKLRSVYPNIMTLDFENSRTEIDLSSVKADADNVSALSTYDLFSEFFFEVTGSAMTEEQSKIMRELLETEGEQ